MGNMAEAQNDAGASQSAIVIDDEAPIQRDQIHQRLRANSTIMQVNKLLGKLLNLN